MVAACIRDPLLRGLLFDARQYLHCGDNGISKSPVRHESHCGDRQARFCRARRTATAGGCATPARLDPLDPLRRVGPCSVYALAKAAARNHSSLHTDIMRLQAFGLVERTEDGAVSVPFRARGPCGRRSRRCGAAGALSAPPNAAHAFRRRRAGLPCSLRCASRVRARPASVRAHRPRSVRPRREPAASFRAPPRAHCG